MKKLFILSIAAYCGISLASTNSARGTFVLTDFPGYGVDYSVNWTDSTDLYKLTPSFTEFLYQNTPVRYTFGLVFSAGSPAPLTVSELSFSAVLQLKFVALDDRKAAMPAPLEGVTNFRLASTFVDTSVQSQGGVVRFSNYSYSASKELKDQSGRILQASSFYSLSTIPTTLTFTTTSNFVPGNFLAASNDPHCADFSCMQKGQDSIRLGDIGLTYAVSVPEPTSSLLLLAGGIFGISLLRKNRQARA